MHLKLDIFKLKFDGEVEPSSYLFFPEMHQEIRCVKVLPKYALDKMIVVDGKNHYLIHCEENEDPYPEDRLHAICENRKNQNIPALLFIPDIEEYWNEEEWHDNDSESCINRLSKRCPNVVLIAGS